MDTDALAAVAARHPVRLLLLHGSTVTGRTHARSDVDLAAMFESGQATPATVSALASDLQRTIRGRDVDLVVLNHADPLFLKRILYQSFLQMALLGVYPVTFGYRIAGCAGLRNRIAHEYDDIDPVKLFDAVRQAVADVPEYLAHVNAWMERQPPGQRG